MGLGKRYSDLLRLLLLISPAEYEVRVGLSALGKGGVERFLTKCFANRRPRIAVHVHLYYTNEWPELAACLANIPADWRDLFLTLVKDDPTVREEILRFDPKATILVVENRGFDIGPFVEVVNRLDLDVYDYVVKLHSKRDVPWEQIRGYNMTGPRWRENLLSFVKTKEAFFKTIACFELSNSVGMIGAEKCLKCSTKAIPDDLFASESLRWLDRNRCRQEYIAGTMFMVRAELLKIMWRKVQITDFSTTVRASGTLAHAFEMAFGYLVSFQGKELIGTDFFRKKSACRGNLKRFFLQYGVTSSRYRYVKIIKIPVFRKKI